MEANEIQVKRELDKRRDEYEQIMSIKTFEIEKAEQRGSKGLSDK